MKLGNVDLKTLKGLQKLQQAEIRRRSLEDPASVFPWHDIQKFVLNGTRVFGKAVRIMLVAGGNRGGKSKVGMGVISQMLRRTSALNEQLRTTDHATGSIRRKNDRDPLTIWVVPPTLEKARQDWLTPQDQMGLKYWCGNLFLHHAETPDNIIYSRPPGRTQEEMYDDDGKLRKDICDKLIIKAHGQDILTFESSEVDLVVFDEEIQNERVWNSVLMRIATTNGIVMMTYTPLHGLCLPGDARVTTGRGMVPISEVRAGDRVAVRNRVANVTEVHENGVRPLVEVKTRRGYTLRCTPEHEWLATDSYTREAPVGPPRRAPDIPGARKVRANELTDDHWIAFNPGHHGFWPDSDLDSEDGYFIGQMVGDGSWRPHHQRGTMKLTTGDVETTDWLSAYLEDRHGVALHLYPKGEGATSAEFSDVAFSELVEDWGVERTTGAALKKVPEPVWRGSREHVRGFLQGLFDADGCADVERDRVSFTTTSPQLARDVQRLLVRFAVFVSLYEHDDGDPNHARRYTLEATSSNAKRYMASVGFRLPRKQEREWAGARNGPGCSWDRVVSVRELGVSEPVYCLTVDDDEHVFAADGFVSGNSWSWKRYWRHLVDNGMATKVGDRCWVYDPEKGASILVAQMGSADNPRAREYSEEIRNDPEMSDAEKDARLDGKYGYVEGALIRALSGIDVAHPVGIHKMYVVDNLPGQKVEGVRLPGRIVKWMLVADPNKSFGALLSALDSDDNLFFVAEHLERAWPDRKHADAFKTLERRYATGPVERWADPGSAGAQSIVNLADSGLYFQPVPKGAGSVSASVKKLRGRTYIDPTHVHPLTGAKGAPRVYFYRPGMVTHRRDSLGRFANTCVLAEQINQARQTDNESAPADTPHKDIRSKLDVFDCARYTAYIASEFVPQEDERTGPSTMTPDRLPTDATLLKQRDEPYDYDPLNPDWDTPFYDFGEEMTWL